MLGRMVRSGVLACPKCGREYPVVRGVVQFSGSREPGAGSGAVPSTTAPRSPLSAPVDAHTLQALLDLSGRSEEHTSELQSRLHLVCRLLLEKKKLPTPPHARFASSTPKQ